MSRGIGLGIVTIAVTVLAVSSQGFVCRDRSNQCPIWRKNIARRIGQKDRAAVCKRAGNDYNFMLMNCAKTCKLCKEAKRRYEQEERKRQEETKFTNLHFKTGIAAECDVLIGSVWENAQNKKKFTLGENAVLRTEENDCINAACSWSCVRDGSSFALQMKWGPKGLHEFSLENAFDRRANVKRTFTGATFEADLVQKDLYRILSIDTDSSKQEIRKTYRGLSRRLHPDRLDNPSADDQARFDEIIEAYEILGDPDQRRIYDAMGASEFHNRQAFENAVRLGRVKRIVGGFYRDSDVVETLTSSTFARETYHGRSPSIVEFYAPWCYHCQKMVGKFKRAAILLESDGVSAASIDCDAHASVCNELRINSFPSIRFFHGRGRIEQGVPFTDPNHDPDTIRTFVDSIVNDRVVELNAKTFKSQVLDSTEDSVVWLVDFSAGSWCGPCTQLRQPLSDMARELEHIFENTRQDDTFSSDDSDSEVRMKIRVGIIECDSAQELCQEQNVPFYPHLRLYSKVTRATSGADLGESLTLLERGGAWAVLDLFSKILRHVTAAEAEATALRQAKASERARLAASRHDGL